VDDSKEDRQLLRTMLGRGAMFTGYAVEFIEAADGEDGIALFKQRQPHLVVSDLLMPRKDGFALCKAIRESPGGSRVPLLVVSGFARDKGAVSRLESQYQVVVLVKPVEARDLIGKTLGLLDGLKREQPEVVEEWRQMPETAEPEPASTEEPGKVEPPQQPVPASPRGVRQVPSIDLTHPVRGTLTEHPLGWLLVHAADSAITGTLKLVRGKVRKLVFIIDGRPIFVDSNLRNETLGVYLVSRNVIDENQLAQALKQARATSRKLGETLVNMGLVDQQTVLDALLAQTRIKLARALIWQDGMFSFLPGDDFTSRVPHCAVDAVEVVLAAQKKMSHVDDLAQRLEPALDQALELTEKGERHRGQIERVFSAEPLGRALSGNSLQDVAQAGLDLPTLLVMVDTLQNAELARLTQPYPPEVRPVPMAKITTVRKAVPRAALENGLAGAVSSDEPASIPAVEPLPVLAQARPRDSELIQLQDLEPARPLSGPTTDDIELFEPGEQVPPIYAEPEDSGVMQVPAELELEEPGRTREPRVRESEELRLREILLQTYLGIHGKSHYEVLGLETGATTEDVARAHREKQELFATTRFKGRLPEEDQDRLLELNLIVEQAHAVLSDPLQRKSYDQTLARAAAEVEPETDAYGAELFYQEGHTLLKQQDIEGAVAAFRRATQENPDQPDYHAHLGWALFLHQGRGESGAITARPHLEHALRVAPDSVRALELAGWVERDAGNDAVAVEYLSQALKLGPPRKDLFEAVTSLLTRAEQYQELEHQYRRLIFRLRTKKPMETLPLWLDLAHLYQTRLGQPENAKLALEVASRLSPGDSRVRAALDVAGAIEEWREVAEGYQRQLSTEPENLEPLRNLCDLHLKGGRHDWAFVAACLLDHHGMASEAGEQRLLQELAPGKMLRQSRPPTAMDLQQIRHADDLTSVENLMSALAPVMAEVLPVSLEHHGSSESQLLKPGQLFEPFWTTLSHVAEQLGQPIPPLYATDQLTAEMVPLPGAQARVLVGLQLLSSKDETAIAFTAARVLSSTTPGRLHIHGRRGTDLKVAVLATLAHCRPGVTPPDPDGAVARFGQAIGAKGLDRDQLEQLITDLLAQDSKVNLSQWMRAVYCTTARVGLLFCADIRPALDTLRYEPHAIRDLTTFALGQGYAQLREELGIAVTV